jgi:HlyD family secretion protein
MVVHRSYCLDKHSSVYIRSVTDSLNDLAKLRLDRSAPATSAGSRGRPIVYIIGGLLLAVVGGYFFTRGPSVVVQTVVATPISAVAGEVTVGATAITANGYVVARTRASVAAKIPGRLATLNVDEGSYIARGGIIGRLENAEYQAGVDEARAALASAQAQLVVAETERDQARREADRVTRIRADRPDLMSTQEAEAAESRAASATARAGSAAAQLEGARASLRRAEANFENTVIRAPFTGTVLRKEAEVGEVVAPSVGGGLTRGAVVTMADLTTLEVEVDVNEAYIGRVSHGQEARITLDAYPDTAFRGRVRQVVPTADRQRATVQVKVTIVDRDRRILPEMGSRVDFIAEAPPRGATPTGAAAAALPRFRLPGEAVKETPEGTVVWIVRDGKLDKRTVQAGPLSAGFREIRSGLNGGELVVTGGVDAPEVGMRVTTGG